MDLSSRLLLSFHQCNQCIYRVESTYLDLKSFKIANCLVGNDLNQGVIEFAYQGPLLKLNSGKTKDDLFGKEIYIEIEKNKYPAEVLKEPLKSKSIRLA